MTIASTTIQTSGSTGNGATTVFSFSFNLDPDGYGATTAASQVQVIRELISTGAEEILTLNTHYTVSVNSDQSSSPGGSITMLSAPSSAYKIWIRLNPDFTQQTDYQNQGGFLMETVEDQADQHTRQILWLKDAARRSPRVGVQAGTSFDGEITGDLTAGYSPVLKSDLSGWQLGAPTTASVSTTMAPPLLAASLGEFARDASVAHRMTNVAALQAATWASADAPQIVIVEYNHTAGDGGGMFRLDASDTSTADNGGTIILTSTSGTALRYKRLYDRLSILFWNVRRDGTAFTRSAFAAALTYASAAGEKLFCPAGRYRHDTDAGTLTLENVIIEGEGVLDGASPHYDKGTVFEIVGTSNSPFTFKRGAGFVGCGFYYPNVTDTYTPTTYPATIDFSFADGAVQFVLIERCVCFNAFDFINIDDASGNVGHVKIQSNYIFAFRKSIVILNNLENIEVHDNVFSFGHWTDASDNTKSQRYYRENGVQIEYSDGDGIWIDSNLFFGAMYGVRNQGGSAIQTTINGNAFDQVRYAVYSSSPSGSLGAVQISNNLFLAFNAVDAALTGQAISLINTAAADKITIACNHFGQCRGSHIVADGTAAGTINSSGNTFELAGLDLVSGSHASFALNCTNKRVNSVGDMFTGPNTDYVNGFNVTACGVLNVVGASFENMYRPLNVSACGTYIAVGCSSTGTRATLSNTISGVTGEAREGACVWDKPAYVSTYPRFAAGVGTITFNSGSATDVTGWTETFDDGGDFDATTGVFTAPVPGRYRFAFMLLHDNTITVGERWTIKLECATGVDPTFTYTAHTANFNSVTGEAVVSLAAAATVKLTITRSSGSGNFVLLADGNANRFSGELLT